MTREADHIFPSGMAQPPPDPAAVSHVMAYFGGLGGRVRSERKAAACRVNGTRGGGRARRGPLETATLARPSETREAATP